MNEKLKNQDVLLVKENGSNELQNKDFLDAHRIDPEDVLKKQAKEQEQTQSQTAADAKTHAISPDLVAWQKFERFDSCHPDSNRDLIKSGLLLFNRTVKCIRKTHLTVFAKLC